MKTQTEYTPSLEAWVARKQLELESFKHYWENKDTAIRNMEARWWETWFQQWLQQDDKPQNPFV